MARPSKYSLELVTSICDRIATSERGLARICREDKNVPTYKTVWNWLNDKDKEEFLHMYVRAKELQADFMADNILNIADDNGKDIRTTEDGVASVNYDHINRSKLRVDTRKWLLAKLMPKKYGDKLEVDTNINNKTPQTYVIGGRTITF